MPRRLVIVDGAELKCTFGSSTCSLKVTSSAVANVAGHTIATVRDARPENIGSFSNCTKEGQCNFQGAGDEWTPQSVTDTLNGETILVEGAILWCVHGGKIFVVNPGQAIVGVDVDVCRLGTLPDGYIPDKYYIGDMELVEQFGEECMKFNEDALAGIDNKWMNDFNPGATDPTTYCNLFIGEVFKRIGRDLGVDWRGTTPLSNGFADRNILADKLTFETLDDPYSPNVGIGTIVAWRGNTRGHVAVVTGWDPVNNDWLVTYAGSGETGGIATRNLKYLDQSLRGTEEGRAEYDPPVYRNWIGPSIWYEPILNFLGGGIAS